MGAVFRIMLVDTAGQEGSFTFDLVLSANAMVVGSHWYFGYSLAPDKDLWPVILKKARPVDNRAELDFGAGARARGDGLWWTDLRARQIQVGQRVLFWDHNQRQIEYEVRNSAPVAGFPP
jgi:hypothetical protein